MKFSITLQLAGLASAFVLPNQHIFGTLQTQDSKDQILDYSRLEHAADRARKAWHKYGGKAQETVEDAFEYTADALDSAAQGITDSYLDGKAWVESAADVDDITHDPLGIFDDNEGHATNRPRKGRPGHGHKKSNQTLYQVIAKSKYTTKLAELINDYPDLVEELNNTDARHTVFAPTDYAFKRVPKSAPKSKEFIQKLLLYHVSPDVYPAGRVLAGRTIPTLFTTDNLSEEETAQRLATQVGLKGLTVNFYSRILAINVWGSNGVIHAVDAPLFPPPPALKLIDLLPEEFSTLELGLYKTGLIDTLNTTENKGGTLFAPSNFAFQRLGGRANAFLFSPPGLKYLQALLKYHVVPDKTLYSDYYIEGHPSKDEKVTTDRPRGPPRGYQHFDLPTLLESKELAVDVSRYGRLIDIRINGYTHASITDGIAQNGVIHDVTSVIIPPRGGLRTGEEETWDGESELDVEDLIERLKPFVEQDFEPQDL